MIDTLKTGGLIMCLLATITPAQADDNSLTDQDKLESLRMDIRELESSIRGASDERRFLGSELEENEKHASRMREALNRINIDIAAKVEQIRNLQQQKETQHQQLQEQRSRLGQQIRAAYVSGRSDYLKLLLNQEDPRRIGRALAYYNYHNRSRLMKIDTTMQQLAAIQSLEMTIQDENKQLVALKHRQEQQLAELEASRVMRQTIIKQLDQFITDQGLELQRLQRQEQELEKLLTNISDNRTGNIEFFEDIAPFDTLRGALQWPVKGRIVHRFGSPRKGADLEWQGIFIDAPGGTEVKAVSTGKVVFADWFKNLGLLLIIEHGDGYMSLYGHNQSLTKKQGDWVLPGEPVALVGDTGGQSGNGLYFEIRHRGKPLNPVKWCRK